MCARLFFSGPPLGDGLVRPGISQGDEGFAYPAEPQSLPAFEAKKVILAGPKFHFPETLMFSQCLFILGVQFLAPFEPSFLELPGRSGHRQVLEPFKGVSVVPAMDFSVAAVARFYPDESQLLELRKPVLDCPSRDAEFLLQSAVPLPVCVWSEDAEVGVKFFCRSVELLDVHIPHPFWHMMVCFLLGHLGILPKNNFIFGLDPT